MHLAAGHPPECLEWLNAAEPQYTFTSQVGQDASIYYSFFAGMLARGQRGVYIDLGANQAKDLSNTWFLDRCLGWSGICIEADPGLANSIRQSDRTCTVVNMCSSGEKGELPYVVAGVSGHLARPGETANAHVPCAPLSDILRTHNITRADFMSIDIEGNEASALRNNDWEGVPIDLILVETAWSNEQLDMLLHDGGFWRVGDVAYQDDVYIRAPRMLKNVRLDNARRQDNWKYVIELAGPGQKRMPATLELAEDGDKIIYKSSKIN